MDANRNTDPSGGETSGHNVPRREAGSTSPDAGSGGSFMRPADIRPWCALDWARGGVHFTTDGENVQTLTRSEELLTVLNVPHRIAAESTFESWEPERRKLVAGLLRAAGHEIYVYRPIHTARRRTETKTDTVDVKTIFRIATTSNLHLYPLPEPDPQWAELRREANRDYQRLRLEGRKPELVERAAAILGPYRDQDETTKRVAGSGRGYSPSLLSAVLFATERTSSRDEFERLLGLHGSAYPSLLRSEIHHHSFRHAKKRGVTWQEYRREIRKLRRRINEHLAVEN